MARAAWRRHDDEEQTPHINAWEAVQRARTTNDVEEIEQLLAVGLPQIEITFARRTDIGTAVLHRLVRSPDPEVVVAVLSNPLADRRFVSRTFRLQPIRRWRTVVQRELARRTDTRRAALWASSRSRRWDIRLGVAMNPAASSRRCAKLARDGVWTVRAGAAGNPTTPPRSLRRLSTDIPQVRIEVASNPNAPPEIIDELIEGDDTFVAGIAVGNPNASGSLLAEVMHLEPIQPWVLARAAKNPMCPPDRVDDLLTWVALGGAGPGDPSFDPRTCIVNPIDAAQPVGQFVASQPPTLASALWPLRHSLFTNGSERPIDVIAAGARDPVVDLRRAVATYRSYDSLRELCRDRDALVRSTAARTLKLVRRPSPVRNLRPMLPRLAVPAVLVLGLAIGFGALSDARSDNTARVFTTVEAVFPMTVIKTMRQPSFEAKVARMGGQNLLLEFHALDDVTISEVRGASASDGPFPISLHRDDRRTFIIDRPDDLQIVLIGDDSTPYIYPMELADDG